MTFDDVSLTMYVGTVRSLSPTPPALPWSLSASPPLHGPVRDGGADRSPSPCKGRDIGPQGRPSSEFTGLRPYGPTGPLPRGAADESYAQRLGGGGYLDRLPH